METTVVTTDKPNLSPQEVTEYLASAFGVVRKVPTLAKYRCLGGGPPFLRANRSILYPRAGVESWARQMLGEPMRSTSDRAGAQ
jgi:hypothetical protein